MKNRKATIICCLSISILSGDLLCATGNSIAGNAQPTTSVLKTEKQDMEALLARLAAKDPSGRDLTKQRDRQQAAEAIRAERTELIGRLIQLAGEKVQPLPSSDPRFVEYPWHDSKHLSILLLGDLRAAEGVPVLLANLEYQNPRSLFGDFMDKDGWYPAVEALCKIGMPAVDPTVAKLGEVGPKSKAGELCSWILNKILGPRLARVRLEITIEETRDAAAKANLKAALPYFKTEQEKAAEERARESKQGQK